MSCELCCFLPLFFVLKDFKKNKLEDFVILILQSIVVWTNYTWTVIEDIISVNNGCYLFVMLLDVWLMVLKRIYYHLSICFI